MCYVTSAIFFAIYLIGCVYFAVNGESSAHDGYIMPFKLVQNCIHFSPEVTLTSWQ